MTQEQINDLYSRWQALSVDDQSTLFPWVFGYMDQFTQSKWAASADRKAAHQFFRIAEQRIADLEQQATQTDKEF